MEKIVKIITSVMFIISFASFASIVKASILIEQVYVNPKITESGGEAILLRNTVDYPLSLENWTLATQVSLRDIIFPKIIIMPNQTFLVGDKDWNTKKDNSFWRNADFEETFTLDNNDGGIAIFDSKGNIIDAVGWGNATKMEFPFYKENPTSIPPEGKVLLRRNNTNNNLQDFIISDPEFEADDTLVVFTNVSRLIEIKQISILPDDFEKEGVQILPPVFGQKDITIIAEINGVLDEQVTAVFGNKTIELKSVNNNGYEGHFFVDASLSTGTHSIMVFVDDFSAIQTFEYFPKKKLVVEQKSVSLKTVVGQRVSGSILLQNQGNTLMYVEAVVIGNSSVDQYIELSLDGVEFQHPSDFHIDLAVNQVKQVYVAVDLPKTIAKGFYTSRIRFKEIS